MTEEPQRRLLGCALFLALVLTTSVAQAQSREQRVIAAYIDCTVAAFRARADQVNDPNLLAEMSLAACPTEEAAVLAWYQWRFSLHEMNPAYTGLYMSRLKLRLKQQMMEAAKTRNSPAMQLSPKRVVPIPFFRAPTSPAE
jgi:hypothetical protein